MAEQVGPRSTLLAVDDQPDNLFVLSHVIGEGLPGCQVITAGSAREGLAIAASTHLDGAIIDVQMPGMDGVEMCRRLKGDPATCDIHVILLTAHEAGSRLKSRGLDAGADDFIGKPIDNIELIARINALLRVKRAEDALRDLSAGLDERVRARTRALERECAERLRVSEALRESDERLRAVFVSMPDYLLLLDREHRVQMINRVEPGVRRQDVIGTPLHELAPSGHRERVRDHLDRVVREGTRQLYHTVHERPDDSTVHFSSIAAPITVAGEVTGTVVCSRDVTEELRLAKEREQLERQQARSRRMESIGRLAGGVAHDFNNLLTVIASYAEFAVADLQPADPIRADIEEIVNAADRAADLTRQLLAFSRRQVMQPRVLDLNGVVANLKKMLGRLIGEHVELACDLAGDLGRVVADPGQLEQIIMNLAINARDAMPDGGALTILTANVERATPCVMLAVTDSGCGMDEATRARAFEPFFTTKDQGQGTGLGLATVYGIVKQSGGVIELDSELGEGTTFRIYLPRAEVAEASPPCHAPCADMIGSETILVVEDEAAVRRLTERMLSSAGYTVVTAADAGAALLELGRRRSDIELLLTDVVMPKMSGKELVDRLAIIAPKVRVLYMSGYPDEALKLGRERGRPASFIGKPFDRQRLLAKVRHVLDRP